MALNPGDLVIYKDAERKDSRARKWLGIVVKLIPGTARTVVVQWINPVSGELTMSSFPTSDTRASRLDVVSRIKVASEV